MAKCAGSTQGACPDNKTGAGVKKCTDDKFRCDNCRQNTSSATAVERQAAENKYCCNEMLCYVRNNANELSVDELTSICLNFYNLPEIETAYDLLQKQYSGDDTIPDRDAHVTEEKLTRQIITLLKHASDDDIPLLVAANLCRIPTTSPDKIDVMSLFKDINILRNRIDNLSRRTSEEVNLVKKDVQVLYQRTEVNSANRPDTLTRKIATELSAVEYDKINYSGPKHSDSEPKSPGPDVRTIDRTDESVRSPLPPESRMDVSEKTKMNWSDAAKKATRLVATGTNKSGLEASHYETTERLFISFLKPDTSENQLQSYIYKHIGCDAKCEKMRHRYEEDFSSFRVTIRKRFVQNLFRPTVWPEKTVIDYFKPPQRRRRGQFRSSDTYRKRYNNGDYDYDNNYNGDHDSDRDVKNRYYGKTNQDYSY